MSERRFPLVAGALPAPASRLSRVLIAGGGTGGHVFPAIATAQALKAHHPKVALLFVGSSDGLEAREVPAAGFELELLRVRKLKGAGLMGRVMSLASLAPAVWAATAILRRFRPQVVVGVGGYASGPAVIAASLQGLPTILLEQNAIPGITNRVLSRLAKRVVIAFEGAASYFPGAKAELLGNPLRAELLARLESAAATRQARYTADQLATPTLVVIGGSQGAHALNELCVAAAPALREQLPGLRVIHQAGEKDASWVCEAYHQAGIEARVESFIHEMAPVYKEADLALCRSGATTLAELTVAGLPAILVPYPYAADDHQAANAKALVGAGGALMQRETGLEAEGLVKTFTELFAHPSRLEQMSRGMQAEGRPRAADDVVSLVQQLVEG
ncbi:MAG: undecaprenyldiphospho-muramoylpentapeptide beta-N-acetylglucosaminyltransferase [Deltaproteobacteria bacterium]|nr:undecaprenyldiphospho-muramoylpentapeptide beta-N-acetylglucosaminyltransferase [Deltaproteobacteria bacterium]